VPATRKRCTKHAPSSKTECGHLNGGKSKAVKYAFPPGYRENAEEEEEEVPQQKKIMLRRPVSHKQKLEIFLLTFNFLLCSSIHFSLRSFSAAA
jgi:hypothetical protein